MLKKKVTITAAILLCIIGMVFIFTKDGSEQDRSERIYLNTNRSIEDRVSDLVKRMTLDEKVGQMVQAERNHITPDEVKDYHVGSILSGGGSFPNGKQADNTPEKWSLMVDRFQSAALKTRLSIPIIYGVDAVHGHNNVVGATIFPHNIGLGAANNVELTEQIGRATAVEAKSTGVHWNFAPVVATAQDIRWGRTYEAFSDNAEISAELGAAYIQGLQGNDREELSNSETIVATAKHFIGEGYTDGGVNQGDVTRFTEEEIVDREIIMYEKAVQAGVRTVMVSFHSIDGLKMHANKRLLTGVLKDELEFDGFVISDWHGVEQITIDHDRENVSGFKQQIKTTVNAGVDMLMQPDNWKETIMYLKELVKEGEIEQSRIDDAVTRILRVKFEAGLFESPKTDESLASMFGHEDHEEIARKAVRESLVLLKNDKVNGTPILSQLHEMDKIFIAGKSANDIGIQSGGWTIEWQGRAGNITPGTTILDGIKEKVGSENVTFNQLGKGAAGHDVAVVVIGELPYAEGKGDTNNLSLSPVQKETIENIRKEDPKIPIVVLLISGRPLMITEELPNWDGLIAGWLPGTEGGGIADVLFDESYDFKGRLPIRWPFFLEAYPSFFGDDSEYILFNTGFGLTKKEETPEIPKTPIKQEVGQ